MKKTCFGMIVALVGTALCVACYSQVRNPLAGVAESHIRGNAPPKSSFNKFLLRDLTAYFRKAMNKPVTVRYAFLRDGPTETGISYPKYYLWVKIFRHGKKIDEGAVRVAAIEKRLFEITHYLRRVDMKKYPSQIDSVFPLPVGAKIRARL